MTDYDGFFHFARIPRPRREGKPPNDGLIRHPSWSLPEGGQEPSRDLAQEGVPVTGEKVPYWDAPVRGLRGTSEGEIGPPELAVVLSTALRMAFFVTKKSIHFGALNGPW